jgi:hypothetical protein
MPGQVGFLNPQPVVAAGVVYANGQSFLATTGKRPDRVSGSTASPVPRCSAQALAMGRRDPDVRQ